MVAIGINHSNHRYRSYKGNFPAPLLFVRFVYWFVGDMLWTSVFQFLVICIMTINIRRTTWRLCWIKFSRGVYEDSKLA